MAIRQNNLVDFSPSQQVGPYGIHALALDAVAAVPFESCWVPLFGAKQVSLELTGSMSTLGVDVFGSNALEDPGNSYTVTIAGTETDGDVVTLTIGNPNLPGGQVAIPHTSAGSESITSIATALTAGINANAALNALGIRATNQAGVITLTYPSFAAPAGAGNPSTQYANPTTVSGAATGSATETIAVVVGTNGTKIGSTLAAFGLTTLASIPRWAKLRATVLTGGGANVTGRLAASV